MTPVKYLENRTDMVGGRWCVHLFAFVLHNNFKGLLFLREILAL
jgi:hypothetical protein